MHSEPRSDFHCSNRMERWCWSKNPPYVMNEAPSRQSPVIDTTSFTNSSLLSRQRRCSDSRLSSRLLLRIDFCVTTWMSAVIC